MNNESSLPEEGGNTLSRQIVVSNLNGLHARPAGRLAQAAQSFKSSITISVEEQEVDAKSILDILTLAAAEGSTLELRATGQDAREALDRLEDMFRKQFRDE
ncbi:HPr family phosphocarrier protein [Salidesulfovibrio brasiliensis]|uniref:HPr family phosphocarrier protein n=1 Tax=Salidesulfovibrio brasiliensis TaxID=221711 RepID=UPI0006CFCA54|nr:HPr family phosphocarrier protein [Salidesulfovibrio brasiliensis]